MQQIGQKIIDMRMRRGLSQEELAKMIKVSRKAICNWEADLIFPNFKNFKALCSALSVDESYFYGTVDNRDLALVECNEIAVSKEQLTKSAQNCPVTAKNEIGIFKDNEKEVEIQKRKKQIKRLIKSLIVFFTVAIFVLIILSIWFGSIAFTPNTGDLHINSINIELIYFIVCLVLLIFAFISEALIIRYYIKSKM